MPKTVIGMTVNEKTTFCNFIGIFITNGGAALAEVFYNTELTFLLGNPDYMGLEDGKEIGKVNSKIILWSLIFSTGLVLTFTTTYDIFGRKLTICVLFLLMALIIGLVPYMGHRIELLILNRTLMSCTITLLYSNPLISDFIKP